MATGGEQPAAPTGPPGRQGSGWSAGRVVGMVFTGIGGLIGLALLVGGIAVLAAYAFGRDDGGYFNSDRNRISSATYAITTERIDLGVDESDWAPREVLGNVRVRVRSEDPVFIGIASDEDVQRYLGEVRHDRLVDFHGDTPELGLQRGGPPRSPPGEQDFWAAKSEGAGEQSLSWDAEFGRWTAVVMRADAGRGVDIEADAGVKLGWAVWVGLGMFVAGLLMTVGAVVVTVLLGRRSESGAAPAG